MGIVHQVCSDQNIDQKIEVFAAQLASVPANQLVMHKLLINSAIQQVGVLFCVIWDFFS
jgi:hypothetical protein